VKIEDITYAMAQLSGKHDVVCRESFPSTDIIHGCQKNANILSSGSALKY
jgi:hypothetical protein